MIWAEPLHVHGLGEAEARYQQGDFLVAAELGRTLASTDGDTLAARVTLVEAAFNAPKDDNSCGSAWNVDPLSGGIGVQN